MASPVTPQAGSAAVIATGGTAVTVAPAGPNGGIIVNPASDADQNVVAEVLYVDPVGTAKTSAYGTTFALQPGQRWALIPGQTTATSVNAASSGHRFSVVYW